MFDASAVVGKIAFRGGTVITKLLFRQRLEELVEQGIEPQFALVDVATPVPFEQK